MLKPRGDLQFGKSGQSGPSNHMRLVVRDFPQTGPVTIRVTASKAPNATFVKYTGKEAIVKGEPTLTKIEVKKTYPKGTNLQKPKFIVDGAEVPVDLFTRIMLAI